MDVYRTINILVSEYNYSLSDILQITPVEMHILVSMVVESNKEKEDRLKQQQR